MKNLYEFAQAMKEKMDMAKDVETMKKVVEDNKVQTQIKENENEALRVQLQTQEPFQQTLM